MKKWKKALAAVAILFFMAAGYGFYLYNKKPADTRKESAAFTIPAHDMVTEYNKDETAADKKYLDKVVAVTGTVTEVKVDPSGQATVFLDGNDPMTNITCSFYNDEAPTVKDLDKGATVTIKGNCTGKLMDIVLNKCSIIK